MIASLREIMLLQFGAAIDMLENAVRKCPDELWESHDDFWYRVYHTLFFLDYYSSSDAAGFSPPEPFTLSELKFDVMPPVRYSKAEMLRYLDYGRTKCYGLIRHLDENTWNDRFINSYMDISLPELIIDNLRHVQHHTAQLNLILRQEISDSPKWVARAREINLK